jgi:hypothetical protein
MTIKQLYESVELSSYYRLRDIKDDCGYLQNDIDRLERNGAQKVDLSLTIKEMIKKYVNR